jgi:hypothetical protein
MIYFIYVIYFIFIIQKILAIDCGPLQKQSCKEFYDQYHLEICQQGGTYSCCKNVEP